MGETKPFNSLDDGLQTLVRCLQANIPLRIWMVTRMTGNEWNVLHVVDRDNEIKPGDVFKWSDTYCNRMATGDAPRFAPNSQVIPAYRSAGINNSLDIRCYIGQPLYSHGGVLLGTLCAVDPEPRKGFSAEQQILVETAARTISTLISDYMKMEEKRQKEAQLHYRAETDALTGLANRHVWEDALDTEEAALQSLGENAMVMIVDLDGLKLTNDTLGHEAGDRLLQRASLVLHEQFRDADVLARVGGDEFAILVRGISNEEATGVAERLREAFQVADVHASVGYAMRLNHRSLRETLRWADDTMYQDKTRRRSRVDFQDFVP